MVATMPGVIESKNGHRILVVDDEQSIPGRRGVERA
jgi:hypothetical protein